MMKLQRAKTNSCLLGLALLATACGDDVDEPTDEDYQDIASSVAPLIRAELGNDGSAQLSAQLAVGHAPGWLSVDAEGSLQGRAASLTWDLSGSCSDVNGVATDTCDASTDAANVSSNFSGELAFPNYSAMVTADADWSIEGLQQDTIRSTGRTSIDASTQFTGILFPHSRSFSLDVDASYDLTAPRANPEQLAGTLQASIDARRTVTGTNNDRDAHFIVDAQVTLDGAGNALIELDGHAQFELVMDSGNLVRIEASL